MKKKMKKSFLLPLIGIIAVITIVGVGFAAWAIISPIDVDDVGGSITAESLTDRTFTITAEQVGANIHFGKGNVKTLPSDAWFRDDESKAQNLSTTLAITLTPNTPAGTNIQKYLENRSIDIELSTSDYDGFKAAIDANYLVLPTLTCGDTTSSLEGDWAVNNLIKINVSGDDFSAASTDEDGNVTSYTATVTVTFAWGSETNGMDPYTYYNQVNEEGKASIELTTDNVNEAKAVCEAVYALNDATYTISFVAVAAPANND